MEGSSRRALNLPKRNPATVTDLNHGTNYMYDDSLVVEKGKWSCCGRYYYYLCSSWRVISTSISTTTATPTITNVIFHQPILIGLTTSAIYFWVCLPAAFRMLFSLIIYNTFSGLGDASQEHQWPLTLWPGCMLIVDAIKVTQLVNLAPKAYPVLLENWYY